MTLGRYSLARFIPGTPIGKIHGQGRKINDLWVVPMYHPAAALHQGSLRKTIEDDFRKIPALPGARLARSRSDRSLSRQPPPSPSHPK